MAILLPLIEGKAPCLPHHREGAEHSQKLGREPFLAHLGGGAVFHEAAADKKLQGNGCLKASYFLGFFGLWYYVGKTIDCCLREVGMK